MRGHALLIIPQVHSGQAIGTAYISINMKKTTILLTAAIIISIGTGIFVYERPQDDPAKDSNIEAQKANAIITINNGSGQTEQRIDINGNMSLFDTMKEMEKASKIDFEYTESEMGVMIESINGTKNDPQKNLYWMYKINGESSSIGASQYKIQPNDTVLWEYKGF